jgi:hypothetical protein
LFIPQEIYEHGEPRWNDIDRRKLLIRPPELSGNSANSHPIAKQEKLGEEMAAEFCLYSIAFMLEAFCNML